jgi:hypothetical protein
MTCQPLSALPRIALFLILVISLAVTTSAHGILTQPRQRGALRTQRNVVPQVIDPAAPIDYCPRTSQCNFFNVLVQEILAS